MSTENEIKAALESQGATDAGKHYVQQVRNSEPARRVGGGKANVPVRFPSQKMEFSIQAESRGVEYPFVRICEEDPNILEFYDQPLPITLRYINGIGRNVGHKHTPDFLVIESDSVYLVECKASNKLEKLFQTTPDRYAKRADGSWYSPAGERAAKRLGIGYRVWTPDRLTTTYVRNLDFLYDYLRCEIV